MHLVLITAEGVGRMIQIKAPRTPESSTYRKGMHDKAADKLPADP